MNIREALRNKVLIPGVSDSTLDLYAIESGIDPEAEYVPESDKKLVTGASLQILYNLRGLKSISEGDYTVTLDPEMIETRISFLENGGGYKKPTISSGSGLW